jgi:Fe-S cluster biogenesis protein NfuA
MNKDKLTHEEIVTKVMEALESIRPFLNNDGGDIELVDVVDNKVMVKLARKLPRLSYEFFYHETR